MPKTKNQEKEAKRAIQDPKAIERAMERLRRTVENQPHPLERYSWPWILTFTYLSPIYDYLALGLKFKPENNYRCPKFLTCQVGTQRASRIVQGEGRLVWRMIKEFRYEFVTKFIRMAIMSVLGMIKIVQSKNLVDALQGYVSSNPRLQPQLQDGSVSQDTPETSLNTVLRLLITVFMIEIIWNLLYKIGWMTTDIFYKKINSTFEAYLFEKKLGSKFNDIHAIRFKYNISAIAQDLFRGISNLMNSFRDVSNSVFLLIYGFWIFGPRFIILIIGVSLSSLIRYQSQKDQAAFRRQFDSVYIEHNSVTDSVFDNLQYIKINCLEDYYYRKKQAIRQTINDNEERMNLRNNGFELFSNLVSLGSKCLFLGLFLRDGGVLTAGFIKAFMDLDQHILGKEGIGKIFGSDWAEIATKEGYLKEVIDELQALERDSQAQEEIGGGEDEEVENGTCLLRGSFYWNLMEEKTELGFGGENDNDEWNGEGSGEGGKEELRVDQSGRKIGFELKEIDFKAEKGSLTMIVGKIGSGKSSLFHALLGEMNLDLSAENSQKSTLKPARRLKGSVAYLGQKPWILNATVKENILLGRPCDPKFFKKCLRYSALEGDLTHWERGVEHVVGQGGVALSGGQKARLALARCLYQDADIYLIDDVTSALDVHVGGMVFNQTIKEFLRGKTVVMTTHNLQFLKNSDFVYYMDNGRILVGGRFEDVQETELFKALKLQKKELAEKKRKFEKTQKVEFGHRRRNRGRKC